MINPQQYIYRRLERSSSNLEESSLSDMLQLPATEAAAWVPGSPFRLPPPSPASSDFPFLGEAVIPLVNKLQDIFSQLGSSSNIDLPQVSMLVPVCVEQWLFTHLFLVIEVFG